MVFLQSLYYVLSMSSRGLFIMMMMMNLVFAGPTGLTLKLIHRDSPESPLYPGNLTQLERMERAFQQSIHREQKLLSTWRMKQQVSRNNSTNNNSKSGMDTVRPLVKSYDAATYMVQLGIGTFSNGGGSPSLIPFYYYFYFDTGSDLLWIQCDTTNTGTSRTNYFRQDQQLYPGLYSLTYSLLPYNSNNHVCRKYARMGVPPEGRGLCGYRVRYGDGASSEGALATEKLTVNKDNGGTEEIKNFVFGCGFRQNEPDFGQNEAGQNPIVGILGLGGGQESFIRQLGDRVQNKFEYCLKPKYEGDHPDTHTFLRFGSDTKIVVGGPGVQTTSIVPVRGDTLYYVIMGGISVDGIPVVYPDGSSVFQASRDGTGGVIFDSGSEETTLSARVYDPLRDHLVNYLSITRHIIRCSPRGRFIGQSDRLCFQRPPGFVSFPIIRFHFSGGAIFEMETEAVFDFDTRMFCLTIRRSKLRNSFSVLLGSTLQTNHRILYDLGAGAGKISWVNENCAADP